MVGQARRNNNALMERSSYQGAFPTTDLASERLGGNSVPEYVLPTSDQVHANTGPRIRPTPDDAYHNSFPTRELPKAAPHVPSYFIPSDSFTSNPRVHNRPGGAATHQNSFPQRETPLFNTAVPDYVIPEGYDDTALQQRPKGLPTLSSKRKPEQRRKSTSGKGQRGIGKQTEWQTSSMSESQHALDASGPSNHPLDYMNSLPRDQRKKLYVDALKKSGSEGVASLLQCVREKVNQRTRGGLAQLHQAFHFFDKDHSSTIDLAEFAAAMEAFGLQFPESQLIALFAVYDKSLAGAIDYEQFSEVMQDETASTQRAMPAGPSLMPWEGLKGAARQETLRCEEAEASAVRHQQPVMASSNSLHKPKATLYQQGAMPMQNPPVQQQQQQQQQQSSRTLRFDKKTKTYTLRDGGATGLL